MARYCLIAVLVAASVSLISACGPIMPSGRDPAVTRTLPVEPFTHACGIRFVVLPAGTVDGRGTPGIQPSVEMRRPLLIGACEVTNAQYEKHVPKHPRAVSAPADNDPVANVTAQEAEAFCKLLTTEDRIGRTYRLPDLEEWEYAARGGRSRLRYPWGDAADPSRACYAAQAARPVGSFPANDFGVHDAAGNVAEWVTTGAMPPYALRGGAWCDAADGIRIDADAPLPEKGAKLDHHGFRVLCDLPPVR